jgi:hypothetical protein
MIIFFLKKLIWPLVRLWRKTTYPIKLRKIEKYIYRNYNHEGKLKAGLGIVFMQDNYFTSGGLVDRTKGLVSSYFLSQYYQLPFSVYFSDVNDPFIAYLKSDIINIITEQSEINYDKSVAKPVIWYNYLPDKVALIKRSLFSKREIHLYSNENVLHLYTENEGVMKAAWSGIFKRIFEIPILDIQNTIGIHLRFIGLLGDFMDLRNHEVNPEQQLAMIEWCENKILEIGIAHPEVKLKIVSDSSNFLEALNRNTKFEDLKHRFCIDISCIGHTAINKDRFIFKKSVEDFIGLSSCNKVIQIRYGKMHRSEFSKYAAISGLKQFELIEHNEN